MQEDFRIFEKPGFLFVKGSTTLSRSGMQRFFEQVPDAARDAGLKKILVDGRGAKGSFSTTQHYDNGARLAKHFLGLQGMPRRYYDYLPRYETGNFLAGFGGYLIAVGIILMLYNLIRSIRQGKPATADPWGGTTLEWSVPSPPPLHNFIDEPKVKDYPYDFSEVIQRARQKSNARAD